MTSTLVPHGLKAFLESAPEGTLPALSALAAAESLTDEVAAKLLACADTPCPEPTSFIRALHYCSFTVERNSEWHFVREARSYLLAQLADSSETFRRVHGFLLDVALNSSSGDVGGAVPAYLTYKVGAAYHQAALDPDKGLARYASALSRDLNGETWLLARLATEQQASGILPRDAIEPLFLEGIVLYREGSHEQAERVLARVALSGQIRIEVAIAAHLVGRLLGKRFRISPAESYLRHSLSLLTQLEDRHGEAQVLHTLGGLLGRRNPDEAEKLLRRSLSLLTQMGDRHGEAEVLHTLGGLLGRRNPDEAEKLLRRSLAIGEAIKHRPHQAQVLYTLGRLVARRDKTEGLRLLRESLALNRELGLHRHIRIIEQLIADIVSRG